METETLDSSIYKSLIEKQIKESYWPGYVHAYPHKKAYRPFPNSNSRDFWKEIPSKINLYFHIPFCYRKCSFCNLFTVAINKNNESIKQNYVKKIIEHIDYYSNFLSSAEIQSIYFGGGTPNTLPADDIGKILEHLKLKFPNQSKDVEPSIECYPDLLNNEYLLTLKKHGIKRISVGIESFKDRDLEQMSRKKGSLIWDELFKTIKELQINLNIDLIYGLPGQDLNSVIENLALATSYNPEQISIYPLALRHDTGMGRIPIERHNPMSEKYIMFDKSREILENAGYKCRSYVNWIKSDSSSYQQQLLEFQGIPTLGIGASARSYTNEFHYALPWKVSQEESMGVVDQFLSEIPEKLKYVGFEMVKSEKRNHFIIYSLLGTGLNFNKYFEVFGEDINKDFSEKIDAIIEQECAEFQDDLTDKNKIVKLTKKGRKYSDIVANLFASDKVLGLYQTFKY